jgi:hydroxymethylpyrimidine pyrophosphatase-like HAD family hydrolase
VIGELGKKEGPIWDYAQSLVDAGYKLDVEDRLATVRVFLDEPTNLSEEQKKEIEDRVSEEATSMGIKTTRNRKTLDLLPIIGGKLNGINFYLDLLGIPNGQFNALGDDHNDFDMIEGAASCGCPGNAKQRIKELVVSKGGYVSGESTHAGTLDMLEHTLKQ